MATVEATMNVYVNGAIASQVFHGYGQFETVQGGGGRFLTTTDGFLNRFETTRRNGVPASGAWLDFNESFDDLFIVNVGDVFLVELTLQTRAHGLIIDGEMLVNSNFYDSGNFLLSLGNQPGLTLTQIPVPEPGIHTLMAIGLGVMGWAGRRRKQRGAAV